MREGSFAEMFSLIGPTIRIWHTEELPWVGLCAVPSGLCHNCVRLSQRGFILGKASTDPVGGYAGQEEVTTYLKPSVALDRFIDSGDFVVALARTQGTALATGKSFDVPLMHLWGGWEPKIVGPKVFLENETMKATLAPSIP
jgi:hypothetical protein